MAKILKDRAAEVLVGRSLTATAQMVTALSNTEAAFSRSWDRRAESAALHLCTCIGKLAEALNDAASIAGPCDWRTHLQRAQRATAAASICAAASATQIRSVVIGKESHHSNMSDAWLRRWSAPYLAQAVELAGLNLQDTRRTVVIAESETRNLSAKIPNIHLHGLSMRALTWASCLLPVSSRAEWLEEWYGEVTTLKSHDRASFTWHLLLGMPSLSMTAWTSPRPLEHEVIHHDRRH
jgi:hypothetical protein